MKVHRTPGGVKYIVPRPHTDGYIHYLGYWAQGKLNISLDVMGTDHIKLYVNIPKPLSKVSAEYFYNSDNYEMFWCGEYILFPRACPVQLDLFMQLKLDYYFKLLDQGDPALLKALKQGVHELYSRRPSEEV